MKKKRKVLVAVLGILGIVLTTAGVTYAFFSYTKTGTKINTIKSGEITFNYQEGSRQIELENVMPMTDAEGKSQTDYFEFTITSDTSRTVDIPYYITVRRGNNSEASMDNIVKVYLTKVSGNTEEEVALSKFSELEHYTNTAINIPESEKAIYNDTVLAGASGYTQTYRLRMWIDTSANYIVQENGIDTYPLQGKSYTLTVNVYGKGNDIGQTEANYRSSTEITALSVGNKNVETTDNENYTGEIQLIDNVVTKNIEIETENPNATVTVENLTPQAMNVVKSKIKRLSTKKEIPIEIKVGTNIYKITVKSENKLDTKVYNLTITGVEPPAPESFATDSWETIVKAIRSLPTNPNAVDVYKPVSGGRSAQVLRKIDLGELGTHYLRVANTSACPNGLESETTCGFVIEFADIISKYTPSCQGNHNCTKYYQSDLYTYVTTTVLDAIPEEIKQYMLDTTVVSGSNSGTNTANNQKIYLLSVCEISNVTDDNACSKTRKLDYYSLNNNDDSRIKQYSNANTQWYLRSIINWSPIFHWIKESGQVDYNSSPNTKGISPAFRIG